MGKVTSDKAISLTNLARFKGKCDDHYKLYRHNLQIEISGDNYLFLVVMNSSPTPITNFTRLSNAIVFSSGNTNDFIGIGGAYYDDGAGAVYPVEQVGIIRTVSPYKLSIVYYYSTDTHDQIDVAQSSISRYTDDVVEA